MDKTAKCVILIVEKNERKESFLKLSGKADKMEYICKRTPEPIKIDGDLTKPQWQKAEKSHRFVDVIGGNPGLYDTRAAVMWDDEALYVGFWIEEPYPNATHTERDSLLWFENDREVFIDGKDSYYEVEINALNTVYEMFYIWKDAYRVNPMFDKPRFDIFENNFHSFEEKKQHPFGCCSF